MIYKHTFRWSEPKFDDASLVKLYNDWIAYVKITVPKDQLLIFNVKQGWKPLCEFLNLPGFLIYFFGNVSKFPILVPDGSFPRLNDSKSLKWKMKTMDIIGAISTVIIYGSLITAVIGFSNGHFNLILNSFYVCVGTIIAGILGFVVGTKLAG